MASDPRNPWLKYAVPQEEENPWAKYARDPELATAPAMPPDDPRMSAMLTFLRDPSMSVEEKRRRILTLYADPDERMGVMGTLADMGRQAVGALGDFGLRTQQSVAGLEHLIRKAIPDRYQRLSPTGSLEAMSDAEALDQIRGRRQQLREAIGPPTTGAGLAAAVAANLGLEGLKYAALGGRIRAALPGAGKAAGGGLLAEAAKDALAYAPVDVLTTLAGPEESVLGVASALSEERYPELSRVTGELAENPVTRPLGDIATGFAGDVLVRGLGRGALRGRDLARQAARQLDVTPEITAGIREGALESVEGKPVIRGLLPASTSATVPAAEVLGRVASRKAPLYAPDGAPAYRTDKRWYARRNGKWRRLSRAETEALDTAYRVGRVTAEPPFLRPTPPEAVPPESPRAKAPPAEASPLRAPAAHHAAFRAGAGAGIGGMPEEGEEGFDWVGALKGAAVGASLSPTLLRRLAGSFRDMRNRGGFAAVRRGLDAFDDDELDRLVRKYEGQEGLEDLVDTLRSELAMRRAQAGRAIEQEGFRSPDDILRVIRDAGGRLDPEDALSLYRAQEIPQDQIPFMRGGAPPADPLARLPTAAREVLERYRGGSAATPADLDAADVGRLEELYQTAGELERVDILNAVRRLADEAGDAGNEALSKGLNDAWDRLAALPRAPDLGAAVREAGGRVEEPGTPVVEWDDLVRPLSRALRGGRLVDEFADPERSGPFVERAISLFARADDTGRKAILKDLDDLRGALHVRRLYGEEGAERLFGVVSDLDHLLRHRGNQLGAVDARLLRAIARTGAQGLLATTFTARGLTERDERKAKGYLLLAAVAGSPLVMRTRLYRGAVGRTSGRLWGAMVGGKDKLATKTWEISPRLGNLFFTSHTLGQKWQELSRARERTISEGKQVARDLVRRIERYPAAMDQLMSRAVDAGLEGEAQAMALLADPEAVRIVNDVHSIFRGLGYRLVQLGMLSDESVQKYAERYAPRLYEEYLAERNIISRLFRRARPTRLRGEGRLKHRAEELPEGLTPVESLSTRAVTGIVQESYLAATEEFFQAVRANDHWTFAPYRDAAMRHKDLGRLLDQASEGADQAEVTRLAKERRQLGKELKRLAEQAEEAGFVKLPETERLGSMAGMWVRKDVANEIEGFAKLPSIYGDAVDFYKRWMRRWRGLKTVANPATHGRNIAGAQILSYLGGGPAPFGPFYHRAMHAVVKDGKGLKGKWRRFYRQARDHGVFDQSYFRAEIEGRVGRRAERRAGDLEAVGQLEAEQAASTARRRGKGLIRRGYDRLGMAYHKEDTAARFAHFVHAIEERGMTPADAARSAEKWIPTYRELSNFTRLWSLIGPPFFAYTAKALPLVGEAAATNPLRFAQIGALATGLGYIFFNEDVPEEVLPPEMRGPLAEVPGVPDNVKALARFMVPTFAPVAEDASGRRSYLDFTYIMPWGDIAEGRGRGAGPFAALPQSFSPLSNPLGSTAYALALNRDPFTEREFYGPSMTPTETAQAAADYIYKQALPSLAPAIPGITEGGWSYQKLVDAGIIPRIEDGRLTTDPRPNWYGETRSRGSAMADVFLGMKQRQIVPARELGWRLVEIDREARDLRERTRRTLRDPAVPESEKQRALSEYQRRAQRLQQQAQRLLELRDSLPGIR